MARSSIGKCIRTLLLNRIGNCCWSIWDLTPRLASSSPTLGVYVILALGIFDLGLETLVGESLPLAATACAATPSSGRFPATPSTFNPAFSPSSFACSRPWQSPQIEALQRCQAAFLSHLPVIAQAREASPATATAPLGIASRMASQAIPPPTMGSAATGGASQMPPRLSTRLLLHSSISHANFTVAGKRFHIRLTRLFPCLCIHTQL